jgi:hypothetical protein
VSLGDERLHVERLEQEVRRLEAAETPPPFTIKFR